MNDKDNDKAKAYFILHDGDVVDKKVVEVINQLFADPIDKNASQHNAKSFLYTLMTADAQDNHSIMNRVMNELFHSGRLRMGSGFGESDFIDSLRQLIRGVVQEEVSRMMDQLERRAADLKRAEYSARYKGFLR